MKSLTLFLIIFCCVGLNGVAQDKDSIRIGPRDGNVILGRDSVILYLGIENKFNIPENEVLEPIEEPAFLEMKRTKGQLVIGVKRPGRYLVTFRTPSGLRKVVFVTEYFPINRSRD